MPAYVLDLSERTEALQVAKAEAEAFEVRHRIRCHAAESLAKLDDVLSLMAPGGGTPLLPDPAGRFEAYLFLRTPDFLRELLALLDVPDAPGKSTMPNLQGA